MSYIREPSYSYFHGTTSATTVLKESSGTLAKVIINSATGTTITLYDNTTATGTVIAVIDTGLGLPSALDFNVNFSTGLTVVSTGTWDFTVTYS